MIMKVLDREKPSALKTSQLFTDRADELRTILDEYELLRQNPGQASVINLSGISGIGKTSLLEKLMSAITNADRASKRESNILYYSFERIHEKNKEKFLLNFAYQLLETGPDTDLSSFLYAYKKLLSATEPEDKVLADIKETHFVKKRGFEIAATIVSDFIPFGGNTFSMIAERLIDKIERGNERKVRSEIDGSSETELRDRLHRYFSYDAYEYFKSLDTPYIVILDGCEKYLNRNGDPDNRKERWIMDLIQRLPNVLWIISGREKLNWPADFGVINIDLPEFDKTYVEQFFDTYRDVYSAPDVSRELRDHVFSLTKGVPVYLRLCLENYDDYPDKASIRTDDIGKDTEELLRRFFDNYSESQKRIMVLLCFLPDGFTPEKAYEIFGQYDKITFMSILDKLMDTAAFENTGAGLRIHSVVRRSVLENADSIDKPEVFSEILNTLAAVPQRFEQNNLWGKAITYREEMCTDIEIWCHTHEGGEILLADNLMLLGEDYYNRYIKFYNKEDSTICKTLYRKALDILKKHYEPGAWLMLDAILKYVSCIELADIGSELTDLAKDCFELIKKEHADEKAESLKYVFYLWSNTWQNDWEMLSYVEDLLDDMTNDDPEIADIRKYIEDFYENSRIDEELPDEYWEDQESAAAELEKDIEKNEADYKHFTETYEPGKDYDEDQCRSLDCLASGLRYQNYDINSAVDIQRKLYDIFKEKSGGAETPDSVNALINIAEYYNDAMIGSLSDAEQELTKAYRILKENSSLRSSVSMAHVLYLLADMCYEQEKISEALSYYKELEHEQKQNGDRVMDAAELRQQINRLSKLI